MAEIDHIVTQAEEAATRAHIAVARLDRIVFRQDTMADPTPELWFVHHMTNEAFKALVRSRTACAAAEQASENKNSKEYRRLSKLCELEADLVVYLAKVVEERVDIMN